MARVLEWCRPRVGMETAGIRVLGPTLFRVCCDQTIPSREPLNITTTTTTVTMSKPKIMSSRLAGMKFMQRTPGSPSTPNTPTSTGPPPSKKQRLSNGSSIASPQTQDSPRETQWYLSFKAPAAKPSESPLRIVEAGYSSLDAAGGGEEEEEEQVAAVPGRKSFGKFNKKIEKAQNPDFSSSSSSEDEEDEDEDGEIEDDPTGVNALIAQGRKEATDRVRAERKAKKKEKEAEAKLLAEQRRKKEVNLNRVTSISGGGGGGEKGLEKIECFRCGEKGHRKQDCPQMEGSGRAPSKLRRY